MDFACRLTCVSSLAACFAWIDRSSVPYWTSLRCRRISEECSDRDVAAAAVELIRCDEAIDTERHSADGKIGEAEARGRSERQAVEATLEATSGKLNEARGYGKHEPLRLKVRRRLRNVLSPS